jgi:hypothetical protein
VIESTDLIVKRTGFVFRLQLLRRLGRDVLALAFNGKAAALSGTRPTGADLTLQADRVAG